MSKCLGCGSEYNNGSSQYCERCEGMYYGKLYAANVRHEVVVMSKQKDLSPESGRMLRYKEASKQRWKKTALPLVDIKRHNIYYQAFMTTFERLTAQIQGGVNG